MHNRGEYHQAIFDSFKVMLNASMHAAAHTYEQLKNIMATDTSGVDIINCLYRETCIY